ncbi:SH2 domain-containing adapter protein D isoform X2 [Anolis carolinensis]|uniref:SH2 domain-containing adapter protein D isoform X2 n=1 Tax=Anolis carolinensis TaxID=28377 RepID=UPI0007DB779B|nr:PREDICTED: SH2 domain-containing adapter protein D isoform X2 [Anolis carolinensis]|eukprot:XP_016853095.1 PREDICTED: SH2 domain-containing adapter protein D isoform X2 [Anolis carolinensis]
MAKWLKDYLSFGGRRPPPQPPKPDYSESEILKAYRAQKSLDFEDPYEDDEADPGSSPNVPSEGKYGSPKHRLIKVDAADLNKSKALLDEEVENSPDQPPGESEYSDPFDAHREAKEDGEEQVAAENNGYMEPYEAQKVVADFQRKSNWDERRVKKSRIGLQLYDTPYEEKEAEADPEDPSLEQPRESRLPQDDERPADEYDQPWEWKKNHISRAFADIQEAKVLPWPPPVGQLTESEEALDPEVQFESPEWERTSSASSKERWRPTKHPASVSKFGRSQSPEQGLIVAERVDPSLPLENQTWFHGTISRADAESLLTLCKEGSYLVRNSETSRNDFSLSLRSSQGFMHMKFTRTKENKFVLGQNSAPFDSIPEVIHYYTSQELPVKGVDHFALLYPVAIQTL